MTQLPAPAEHGAVVARLTVPTCLAAIGAMFPAAAPAVALATPFAVSVTEYVIARPTRLLAEALSSGAVVDLSEAQAAALVPMGYRFFLAARQGEYERNLKLLAAFLTAELRSEACEPGSFIDMARRVEGLSLLCLRAVALIGESLARPAEPGKKLPDSVTAPYLANPAMFAAPMDILDATDALADLAGRGFLYPRDAGIGGGNAPFYAVTRPLHSLIARAWDIAQTETCRHPSTDDDAC